MLIVAALSGTLQYLAVMPTSYRPMTSAYPRVFQAQAYSRFAYLHAFSSLDIC